VRRCASHLALVLALAGCTCQPEAPRGPLVRGPSSPPADLPCAGVDEEPAAPPASDLEPPPPEGPPRQPDLPEAQLVRSYDFPGAMGIASGTWHGVRPREREVVVPAPRALLVLHYPLGVESRTEILARSRGGITMREVLRAIRARYAEVYREEDASPEPGPWWIWGHDMGDLFLEGISVMRTEDDEWRVEVGVGS
jgi:hypothetical protein